MSHGVAARARAAKPFADDYRAVFLDVESRIAEGTALTGDALRRATHAIFTRLLVQRFLECKGWPRVADDRFADLAIGPDLGALPSATLQPIVGSGGLLGRHRFTLEEPAIDAIDGPVDPGVLGRTFESLAARRAETGSYYTPRAVVAFMCRRALAMQLAARTDVSPASVAALIEGRSAAGVTPEQSAHIVAVLESLTIADPSCGCGAFLVGMLQEIVATYATLEGRGAQADRRHQFELKQRILSRLRGADVDPLATSIARLRLWLSLGADSDAPMPPAPATLDIRAGDALFDDGPLAHDRFDIVLVNPPYLNMVRMDAVDPAYREKLRRTFVSARGAFDLFVPFVERSAQLTADGGTLSCIVPNKILSAEYASSLRRVLRRSLTVASIADLSRVPVFDAAVYPVVITAQRRPPQVTDTASLYRARATPDGELSFVELWKRPLGNVDDDRWSSVLEEPRERQPPGYRRKTKPLCDIARVSGAATVSEAYEWKKAVIDEGLALRQSDPSRYAAFVVSGNIRRHFHTWPREPVQYIKTAYRTPVLDKQHGAVSLARAQQIESQKLIVAGIARRPTCVWDGQGMAAGKSTVIVIPPSAGDGLFLAALLNSSAMAEIYTSRFGTLALSGGYLRFGPPQVRVLPVPDVSDDEKSVIAALAMRCADLRGGDSAAIEQEIDERIARLFYG
jgi:hypothetical protein